MADHVFISYSRADGDYVRRLVEHLGRHGVPVWVDDKLDYGDEWAAVLREQIASCAALVAVMTPTAEASPWVEREIAYAEQLGKPIRPLLLAGQGFFRLGDLQRENVTGGELPSDAFVAGLRALTRPTGDPVAATAPAVGWRAIADGFAEVSALVARTLGPQRRRALVTAADGRTVEAVDARGIVAHHATGGGHRGIGAELARDLVSIMDRHAGDGTASAVVFTAALLSHAATELAAGANPAVLDRGIGAQLDRVGAELGDGLLAIETKEQLHAVVATATGAAAVADLVTTAFDKVGRDGAIVAEAGSTRGFELSLAEGLRLDQGYLSAQFVTDPVRDRAELESPCVLLIDGTVSDVRVLLPALERVKEANRSIAVIARDLDGDALTTLVVNHVHHTLRSVAVRAPGYGDRQAAILGDIAVLTGARVVTPAELTAVTLADFGNLRRIVATAEHTTLVDTMGDPQVIGARVHAMRAEIERAGSAYDAEMLQRRFAAIAGGVACLRFGGRTAAETEAVVDSLNRTLLVASSAATDGVLPGGLLWLARRPAPPFLAAALRAPFDQVVRNAGHDPARALRALEKAGPRVVYDVSTDHQTDALSSGIVDSARTIRTILAGAKATVSRFLALA
ncbi:chaperonin GroEL [Allocatelliglobosispora scoriae]|uniref:60 kDa chaperonin n=1 Tax=Allocatelliglobosispora scoriae TaxID=643052 RepID=A0A841BPV1_9ACTN|nr:TCP-1/cpn60 chaperonin family protein [Allocatelliglobosispora scoriae]MBB5870294.1 chaperonin GroEL [Allocatelliglobosispora scoriae]